MSFKFNKNIKTALLSAFMMINSNYSLESSINKPSFSEKNEIELENILKKENKYYNSLSFEDALKFNSEKTYQKLINNALKNNTHASLDSVIKFIPIENINKYLAIENQENNNNNTNYNKLITLTKSGEEIAQDRFNFQGKRRNSLKSFSNHLGVKLGDYGTGEETEHFLKLYSEDLTKTAEKYNIEPNLLAAVAISESGGRTFTFSKTGALGPFGLTKYTYNPTGAWLDGEIRQNINPFNTLDAMDRAADLLSELILKYRKFDDSKHTLALTAYNQGEREVNEVLKIARENGIVNPREIINYSQKEFVNTVDSISNNLEPNLNNNKLTYLITNEGRGYSTKVQNKMNHINKYFNHINKMNPKS